MKSVLISIQPKWVEKICHKIGNENGKPIYEKVVEVRKTRPKIKTPFKCYIYCTNSNGTLFMAYDGLHYGKDYVGRFDPACVNGKVIGEFVCDRIDNKHLGDLIVKEDCERALQGTCLTKQDILAYLSYTRGTDIRQNYKMWCFYGWHISDLKIYDKPKELSEFYSAKWDMPCENKKRGFNMDFCMAYENGSHFCKELNCDKKRLTRPPQSWCYVEV